MYKNTKNTYTVGYGYDTIVMHLHSCCRACTGSHSRWDSVEPIVRKCSSTVMERTERNRVRMVLKKDRNLVKPNIKTNNQITTHHFLSKNNNRFIKLTLVTQMSHNCRIFKLKES